MRFAMTALPILAAAALAACTPSAKEGDSADTATPTVAASAGMASGAPSASATAASAEPAGKVDMANPTVAQIDAACRSSVESQLKYPDKARITFANAAMSDGREAQTEMTMPDGTVVGANYACNIQGDGSVKAMLNAD